jgi:hypothetical protein
MSVKLTIEVPSEGEHFYTAEKVYAWLQNEAQRNAEVSKEHHWSTEKMWEGDAAFFKKKRDA